MKNCKDLHFKIMKVKKRKDCKRNCSAVVGCLRGEKVSKKEEEVFFLREKEEEVIVSFSSNSSSHFHKVVLHRAVCENGSEGAP
jgi:hypothetical protein